MTDYVSVLRDFQALEKRVEKAARHLQNRFQIREDLLASIQKVERSEDVKSLLKRLLHTLEREKQYCDLLMEAFENFRTHVEESKKYVFSLNFLSDQESQQLLTDAEQYAKLFFEEMDKLLNRIKRSLTDFGKELEKGISYVNSCGTSLDVSQFRRIAGRNFVGVVAVEDFRIPLANMRRAIIGLKEGLLKALSKKTAALAGLFIYSMFCLVSINPVMILFGIRGFRGTRDLYQEFKLLKKRIVSETKPFLPEIRRLLQAAN